MGAEPETVPYKQFINVIEPYFICLHFPNHTSPAPLDTHYSQICVPILKFGTLGGGGGGGGDLGLSLSRYVCVQKRRTWVLFGLQGSEMSENISLKMGLKFAASHNMGKNLC